MRDVWEKRPEFSGFHFTGPLRPAALSPPRLLPPSIGRPDYADDPEGDPRSEMEGKRSGLIPVYTPEQIEGIRESCRLTAEILAEAGKVAKPGVTTDEIDRCGA